MCTELRYASAGRTSYKAAGFDVTNGTVQVLLNEVAAAYQRAPRTFVSIPPDSVANEAAQGNAGAPVEDPANALPSSVSDGKSNSDGLQSGDTQRTPSPGSDRELDRLASPDEMENSRANNDGLVQIVGMPVDASDTGV
jgi:hypothetical protein